jgi:hypothetical protein
VKGVPSLQNVINNMDLQNISNVNSQTGSDERANSSNAAVCMEIMRAHTA